MKKILFFCILSVLFFPPVFADTLVGGFPVCVTKKTYEQYMKAWMEENEKECRYLIKSNLCFLLPGGTEVTILNKSLWNGWVEIRVYTKEDEAFVMWTHYKNIKREKNAGGN